jgi:transposase
VRWAAQEYGWTLQVVDPANRQVKRYAPDALADLGYGEGFHVSPRRWVVERTFSWLGRHRRLSKDDERLASTEEGSSISSASGCSSLAWRQPRKRGFSNT